MRKNKYLKQIIEKLKTVNPYKVILFGSVVKGEEGEESDIDLIVILDSEKILNSYEDRLKNKIKVRKSIYELSKKVPIDLMVYTRGEYEIISKNRGSFFKEVEETGKIIYEKTDKVLA